MKHVMILTRKLSGGGAERVAASLASYLQDHCQVVLVVLDGKNPTYESDAETVILHLSVEDKGRGWRRAKWFFDLIAAVKRLKKWYQTDVCISFLTEPELANVLTKGKGKAILSVRNVRSSEIPGRIKRLRDRLIFARADAIVALSYNVGLDLQEHYGVAPESVQVIYNICERQRIAARMTEREIEPQLSAWFAGDHTVITTGRLTEQKGQWHMIRAFRRVVEAVPDAKLVILGEGEERAYLTALIRDSHLEQSVALPGFRANPYIYERQADVFVFSSLFEGLGNSLLEAMACGLPIISTDCNAGPRELLAPDTDFSRQTSEIEYAAYGVLTPVCDGMKRQAGEPLTRAEEHLAQAITAMLSEPDLRMHYRNKSMERGKAFDKDAIVGQWIDCIERVTDGNAHEHI